MHAISFDAKGLTWYNQQQYETFHSQVCNLQDKPDRFVLKRLLMPSHCLNSHGTLQDFPRIICLLQG